MRNFLTGLLLVCAWTFASSTWEYGVGSGNFVLFVPSTPDARMIVALHGSGERGKLSIENWQKEAEVEQYYVLAPNSDDPSGWGGSDIARVMSLVQQFKQKLGIKKTLLNGASAGGHFALFLGITYPEYFDGVATFMGLVLTSIGEHIQYQTDPKKKIQILLIHGMKDDKIPIQNGRMNYYFLEAKGYPVTYWEEPNMTHEFYKKDTAKILNWFEKLPRIK
ncbi:MAG: alpha/beta hydrolase-fold protein [Candidatus Margulisiibacteriota bacterium]